MLGQITNITSFSALALQSQGDTPTGPLPAKNSIVNLSVIEKTGADYKLLINGKVFQSVLPVNMSPGDSMLGIVLNNNPMTLNLVNILNLKSLTVDNLAILLAKLGVKKSETALSALKAFIINKKPILKKQLEKIAEALEELDFQFDEAQINYIIQVFTNEQNFRSFDKNCAEYFKYPFETIVKEIFEVIENKGNGNASIDQIGSMLSINPEDERIEKGMLYNLVNSDKLIAEWIKENRNNSSAGVQQLIALFNRYLVQKGFLRREGIYPGFVISRKTGGNELVEYRIERGTREDGSVHYLLHLGMSSFELGDVMIEGLLTRSNLSLSFGMNEKNKEIFEEGLEALREDFSKNLGLIAFMNVNTDTRTLRRNKRYSLSESINRRA
jgi:hypothetical protein